MSKFFKNVGLLALVGLFVFTLGTISLASPPVPPPEEGFVITTACDVEVAGDLEEQENLTWTWMHNTIDFGPGLYGNWSTLAHPERNQFLDWHARAAQVRYTEELNAVDGSVVQFKKDFVAKSDDVPNAKVSKDFGYVASPLSLIAVANDKERVGLSIVANGDTAGLGDMPSLCPWAQETVIPATNEFIAAGSSISTTSVMTSHTDTDVSATKAPELNHAISASGTGNVTALMKVALMEGDEAYYPVPDYIPVESGLESGPVPNLISKTTYDEKSSATGAIDKFNKTMHYHSTIPAYQMPEPWYLLQ